MKITADESTYSRKTIVWPAKVNSRSLNAAGLSKKLTQIAPKDSVLVRQYGNARAVDLVARRRHVGTFYIGHER
jgi:hypothetical protein